MLPPMNQATRVDCWRGIRPTPVAQCTVGPPLVIPGHPVPNDTPRFLKRLELVLPDTLFLETAKEPFDDPILLRRVRRDELLRQAVIPRGLRNRRL